MDDMFCNEKRKESSHNLSEANKLKLTVEREQNGGLPMLDMDILSSTWYTKPSSTGLLMNYHELAPKQYKYSVVSGMVHLYL